MWTRLPRPPKWALAPGGRRYYGTGGGQARRPQGTPSRTAAFNSLYRLPSFVHYIARTPHIACHAHTHAHTHTEGIGPSIARNAAQCVRTALLAAPLGVRGCWASRRATLLPDGEATCLTQRRRRHVCIPSRALCSGTVDPRTPPPSSLCLTAAACTPDLCTHSTLSS